jgi:hypothetical protein
MPKNIVMILADTCTDIGYETSCENRNSHIRTEHADAART